MGFRVNGQCYQTLEEAKDIYFSSWGPFYLPGTTSYHAYSEKTGVGVWQLKRQSISSTGSITNLTSTNMTIPSFPACDETLDFKDGMLLGWGVAAAMIAAWGIRFMATGLQR